MHRLRLINIVILTSILMLSSCTEWGETITFEIKNNTDRIIKCIFVNNTNPNDTILIGINERTKSVSNEDTGNAVSEPFYSYQSVILIYNDSLVNEYHRDTQGKNPLSLEYYEETYRNETKSLTTITYEYLVEISDF